MVSLLYYIIFNTNLKGYVKQEGNALQFVKEQTHEICLEAVKNNGWALQYVKEQTSEICLAALKESEYKSTIAYIKEQTPEICLEAVKINGNNLEYVKEQTEEICIEAVKEYGPTIKYVKEETPNICFFAFLDSYSVYRNFNFRKKIDNLIENNFKIENTTFCIQRYKNSKEDYSIMGVYTKEEQLELIKSKWSNLKDIDNQYEEVCIEAINKNIVALKYVKDQSHNICLYAIQKNPNAIKYIKDQTPEICLEAVKKNGEAIKYVENQTHEICLEAIKENWNYWDNIKFIKNPTSDLYAIVFKQKYIPEYDIDINNINLWQYFNIFIDDYSFLKCNEVEHKLNKYIDKYYICDGVFCPNMYYGIDKPALFFDKNSFIFLKDFLLNKCYHNKYIFPDFIDINLLKEISLSNNELILVDEGNIQEIHKILANKIISKEDLEEGLF